MDRKQKGDEIIKRAVAAKSSYNNIWQCYETFKRELHDLCIFDRDYDLVDALEIQFNKFHKFVKEILKYLLTNL